MTVAWVRDRDGAIIDVFDEEPGQPPAAGSSYVQGNFDRALHLGQRVVNGAPEIIPSPPLPVACSPLQARRALRQAGLLAQVNNIIAQADADTKDAWEYATIIHRDNPVVATMAAALGLTSQQVDDLFALAVTL